MATTRPTVLRLSPDDDRSLLFLLRCTSASSKADVVRFSLELMRTMWRLHSSGAFFSIRDDEGELYTLHMGDIVEGGTDISTNGKSLTQTLQLRLGTDHRTILDWLISNKAAISRSAAVRASIELYREVIMELDASRMIVAVLPPSNEVAIDVPGAMTVSFESCSDPTPYSSNPKEEIIEHPDSDMPDFEVDSQISIADIKNLHIKRPWESILIRISKLHDDDEFFTVVKHHILNGTKLFYIHYDKDVLRPFITRLQREEPELYRKCRRLLCLIKVDETEYDSFEEMVIFDFLDEKNSIGFNWDADEDSGYIASRHDLHTLAREFRGLAKELENEMDVLVKVTPPDVPVTYYFNAA